jgi:hypothetical protein
LEKMHHRIKKYIIKIYHNFLIGAKYKKIEWKSF